MKKLIYLIVLALILGLVLTGCTLLSNIGQAPVTEQSGISYLTKGSSSVDLVGLWHFDGDALDSSGNGNDGTITGATDAGSANAMFGGALSFNGVDEYVRVPDSASLDLSGEITVEAWIKVDVHKNHNAIVIKGEDGAENYELLLTSTGLLYSTIKFTDGTRCYPSVPSAITDTEWHHVAMTYKPGEWRIYIDGVKMVEKIDISKTPLTNDVPLFIGAEQYGGSFRSERFFNGIIDEVRIWNTALTEAQIEQSYALGTAQPAGGATVVELGQEFFGDDGDEVVIFTSSFYGLNAICKVDELDTVDIYMMSNYGDTIEDVSARKKLYTPNNTTGCTNIMEEGVHEGTSTRVKVGKYDCKSIHLSLDLTSGRSVGFNAQFLPYD